MYVRARYEGICVYTHVMSLMLCSCLYLSVVFETQLVTDEVYSCDTGSIDTAGTFLMILLFVCSLKQ